VHVNGQILARTTVPQVTLRGLANAARETVYAVACNQYGCSLPSPQAAFFTPPLPAQASAVAQAAVAAVRPAAAPAAPAATTASRIAAALTQAADHARLATEAANAGNVTGAQQDVALAQQSLATATALGATAAQTAAARAAITAAQNAVAAAQRRAAAQAAAQAPSSTLGARRLYELGAGPPPTTTPTTTTTAPAARTTAVQPSATVANLSSLLARPPAPPTPAPPPAPGYAPQLTEAQQALARAIASLQQSQNALRYVLGVGPTRWPGGRPAWQGEVNSITTAIRYWQAQIRQLQAA
jgi:hypothetical protein